MPSLSRIFPRHPTLSLAFACLSLAACNTAPAPARSDAVAFVNVTVVPMDRERTLAGHTVIVEDGRITTVAPSQQAKIPEGAQRIDGRGKYLMPGLAEMHGHVPGPDKEDYARDVLFLYVSNGVTTVRNMAGDPWHIDLRRRINAGEVIGPTLYAASPWLGDEQAGTPEQAERAVREYHAAGFDLLKIGSLPAPAYARMAQTANSLGMPFGGHIPEDVGLIKALDVRQASIDHFDRYVEFLVPEAKRGDGEAGFFGSGVVDLADRGRIPEAIARTKQAGTWNVSTLSIVEHLASDEPGESMAQWPEMRYLPRDVVEGWVRSKREYGARADFQPAAAQQLVQLRRDLLKALHDADAPIALGSDAPQFFNVPGFSIHHELRMMVAAGLTPYEVLATGTREAARYFDAADEFGTVAPGMRADLILLDADPLADVGNVKQRAGVMVRGKWWPEAEIQARLDDIAK
jgi:imidazolonepropionase-like amidohydrolase